jgi:hypothetical protein
MMMRGRPAILVIALVFTIASITFWWHSTDRYGQHGEISSLISSVKTSLTPSANNFDIQDRVAVIIETRPLLTLIPLILHFANVLGPQWPIMMFTQASTVRTLSVFGQGSAPFARMVASGQIKLVELPSDQYTGNYVGISHFLASKWFWAQFGSAEYMFLFQTDSMICSNSAMKVEDFFGYDFVGAAHPFILEAFNGGLSLRNVTLSRIIVDKYPIEDDIGEGTIDLGAFEDVWFCDKMKKMNATFPSRQLANKFSVDYFYTERPLGYHGINKGQHVEKLNETYAWCPEARLGASQEVLNLTEEETARLGPVIEDGETKGGAFLPFGIH